MVHTVTLRGEQGGEVERGSGWAQGAVQECVLFNIYAPGAQNNPHLRFTSLVPQKILDSKGEIVVIFQPHCQALEIKT